DVSISTGICIGWTLSVAGTVTPMYAFIQSINSMPFLNPVLAPEKFYQPTENATPVVVPGPFGTLRQSRAITAPFISGTQYAYPSAVQQGSLLVVTTGHDDTSAPTVSDTQGNTWAIAGSNIETTLFTYRTDIFYAIAGTTSANSVTITCTNAEPAALLEYYGPWPTPAADSPTNRAAGNSSSPSSGNITPTVDGAMPIGLIDAAAITGGGAGWTADLINPVPPNGAICVESRVQTTAAAVAATATFGSAQFWTALVVAFKPVPVSPITGGGTEVLDDLTVVATGTAPVAGAAATTLEALTAVGAATSTILGAATKTLDVVTVVAVATVTITGAATPTLAALTL